MKLRVLGCYGGQLPGKRLTSFLINDETLIDTGGVTGALTLAEQNRVSRIVISHSHLDHIKDIPMLADNVIGMKPDPVEVISAAPVVATIRDHVLNNAVWPDFTVIPTADAPVLTYVEAPVEKTFNVGDLEFELVEVNHPVPTFAMFITEGDRTLLFTADTGPTEKVWQKAQDYKSTLKAVIIETSFPNKLEELSLISGHLSPCHLPVELAKLDCGEDVPIYLYHFKPAFEEELEAEVKALADSRIRPLVQDETIEI